MQKYVMMTMNATQSNISWMNKSRSMQGQDSGQARIALGVLMTLVMALAICGNILVLLAMCCTKFLRRLNNYLIISLAAVDLIAAFLIMPLFIMELFNNYTWVLPETLCLIYAGLELSYSVLSVLNLTAISIERVFIIKEPLIYQRLVTQLRMVVVIAVLWIVGLTYGMLQMLWLVNRPSLVTLYLDSPRCHYQPTFEFAITHVIILFFIPLVVMIVVYLKIFNVVQAQMRRIRPRMSEAWEEGLRELSTFHSNWLAEEVNSTMEVRPNSVGGTASMFGSVCNIPHPDTSEYTLSSVQNVSTDPMPGSNQQDTIVIKVDPPEQTGSTSKKHSRWNKMKTVFKFLERDSKSPRVGNHTNEETINEDSGYEGDKHDSNNSQADESRSDKGTSRSESVTTPSTALTDTLNFIEMQPRDPTVPARLECNSEVHSLSDAHSSSSWRSSSPGTAELQANSSHIWQSEASKIDLHLSSDFESMRCQRKCETKHRCNSTKSHLVPKYGNYLTVSPVCKRPRKIRSNSVPMDMTEISDPPRLMHMVSPFALETERGTTNVEINQNSEKPKIHDPQCGKVNVDSSSISSILNHTPRTSKQAWSMSGTNTVSGDQVNNLTHSLEVMPYWERNPYKVIVLEPVPETSSVSDSSSERLHKSLSSCEKLYRQNSSSEIHHSSSEKLGKVEKPGEVDDEIKIRPVIVYCPTDEDLELVTKESCDDTDGKCGSKKEAVTWKETIPVHEYVFLPTVGDMCDKHKGEGLYKKYKKKGTSVSFNKPREESKGLKFARSSTLSNLADTDTPILIPLNHLKLQSALKKTPSTETISTLNKRGSVVFKMYDEEISMVNGQPNVMQVRSTAPRDAAQEDTISYSSSCTDIRDSVPNLWNPASKKHTSIWAKRHFQSESDYDLHSLQRNESGASDYTSSRVGSRSVRSRNSFRHRLRENKAARMTAYVIGAFAICWLPYEILFLVRVSCDFTCTPDIAWNIVTATMFLQAAINPFIYNFYSSEFRKATKSLLSGRKNQIRPV